MKTYRDIVVKVDGKTITDYISFIWTDRYNTCGDFEMEIPFSAENNNFYKADQIVTCNLSDKKMIIETIKISISAENGKRMLVSGRSYESVLDRRVVAITQIYDNNFFDDDKFVSAFNQIFACCFGSSNREQVLTQGSPDPNTKQYKKIGSVNSRRSAGISCGRESDPYNNIKNAQINIEATGQSVLSLLEGHCQAKDFGFKFTGGTCYIYDGRKRNVEFSLAKGNLVSADYSASKENYKNSIYIQGEEYQANQNKVEINDVTIDVTQLEEGTAVVLTPSQTGEDPVYYRANVSVDGASGLNRREMYINSSKSIGQNSNTKYVARLESEGRVELMKNHRWQVQASCEVMHDPNIVYGKDYYLGDIVTVALDSTYNVMDKSGVKQSAKSIAMRVNEYTISHSDAGLDLYPTLVAYDSTKLEESNNSDAGITDEDPNSGSGYNQIYNKWVRVEFDFNGGHINSTNSGEIYSIPETTYNKKLINGIYQPNTWYIIPENVNPGVIDTSIITGKFSYQHVGDFVTGPGVEPVKEHYIFQGWFDKNPPGRKFEEHVPGNDETGYLIENVGEIHFIAKWEIEKYDITFDHGTNGRFTSGGGNENGQIVYNLAYGSYPSPPGVIPEPEYHAANPLWSPEIKMVEEQATYTAQWEPDGEETDENVDPENADYGNEELPTDGTEDKEESSTLGLVHFRTFGSRINDNFRQRTSSDGGGAVAYGIKSKYGKEWGYDDGFSVDDLIVSSQTNQYPEWVYTRELKNGCTLQVHWFDPWGCDPNSYGSSSSSSETYNQWLASGKFARKQQSVVGLSILKGDNVIAYWSWSGPGGYHFTPEIAFTTVPAYVPYYEYTTLLDGYNRGDIHLGTLTNAPIFIPFKYFKKIGNVYWLLCVPPLDWISNWGSYYYFRKAGHYVGFTCQFYDDLGNLLSPTWVRSEERTKINVNGTDRLIHYQCTYGYYIENGTTKSGPNTIYYPQATRMTSGSNLGVDFNSLWIGMGWKWRKVPLERWSATEVWSPSSTPSQSALESYEGPLLLPKNASDIWVGNGEAAESVVGGWGHNFYNKQSIGMVYGPGFPGYEGYTIRTSYMNPQYPVWELEHRSIGEGGGSGDFKILFKQAGSNTLGARIIQQINNVISKSNSLSYFTYKIWLPIVAKVKSTTWYVSSDGQNWEVISWAHGNSVKIKTTDKTVAQNEAAGLTGADAIVGTNGSYYKSEVRYTDEDDNEFMQTSDVGRLTIDDTDISGAGIEMGDYMNSDGTTNGVDIATDTDLSQITDSMKPEDLTSGQKMDIENMFKTGQTADMIAESTGVPKWIVDAVISKINES